MNTAGSSQGNPAYSAFFDVEEREVTVIRDVWAAVSGPVGDYTVTSPEGLDWEEAEDDALTALADAVLFGAGYLVAGPWEPARYQNGFRSVITRMVAG